MSARIFIIACRNASGVSDDIIVIKREEALYAVLRLNILRGISVIIELCGMIGGVDICDESVVLAAGAVVLIVGVTAGGSDSFTCMSSKTAGIITC